MRKAWLGVAVLLFAASAAMAAAPERWIHVKVDSSHDGGSVRVNVPLSFAEKILPTIDHGNLHHGKITCAGHDMDKAQVRAILEAVYSSPEGEFVTVQSRDADVRVAKSKGNLLVNVRDHKKSDGRVEVQIPMKVIQALLSSGTDELDLVAAIYALEQSGVAMTITVHDENDHVRVWIDSKSETE